MATQKENHAPPESKIKSSFKSIFYNATNIAVQGFNIKGEVVYWNSYSEKLFGFTESEVKGKALKGFFTSEADEKEFKKYLKNAIRNNKPSPKREWTITTKKGEILHVLCHIFPAVLTALPGEESIAIAMNIDKKDSNNAKECLDV